MPLIPTRVLIINRQLDFAVTVKKSLEQIGGYEVSAFTSPDAAIEHLQTRPHDVLMVDFGVRGMTGIEVVMKARALQPDIAIIASPRTPEILRASQEFVLQEVVDTPLSIRQLVNVLKQAVQAARQTLLPDTTEAPSFQSSLGGERDSRANKRQTSSIPPLEMLQESYIENRTETIEVDISDVGTGDLSVSGVQSSLSKTMSVFDQLAAEEPPLPDVEEGATVRDFQASLQRDLRDSLLDSGERVVVELLSTDLPLTQPRPLPLDEGDSPDELILARKILEGTLDHTSSVKALVEEVAPESQMLEAAAALDQSAVSGSAADTTAGAYDEHDFAPHDLEQLTVDLVQASLESTAEATILSRGSEIIASAGNLAAEDLDELRVTVTGVWKSNETQSRLRFVTLRSSGKDYMLFSRRLDSSDDNTSGVGTDDRILTMVFAGNMPLRVIRRQSDKLLAALRQVPEPAVASPMPPPIPPLPASAADAAAIREAASSRIDAPSVDDKIGLEVEYPEYSVEVGSESSMILPFDEPKYPLNIPTATDLSQAPYDARLIERDLPPVTAVSGQPAPKVIYSPYTYLWLMRDANQTISNAVAQAIVVGLDTALTQRGWTINTLRVHEDYIYLHGQMPDDRPANDIIAELKRLSAEIAVNKDERLNAETLWADSYLALYPGRELEIDEVKRFLDFGRAG